MIFKVLDRLYSQERDQTADLLKGFAVLMMIQVHVTELFATSEFSQSIIGRISIFLGGPPAAPVFMAVMGYFLAQSKRNFSGNIKRGLVLILGGILLNIGLNLHLLILNFLGKVQVDPLKYIFGADILPLAGLSIILIASVKWISKNKFYATVILSLLIVIIILIFHFNSVDSRTNNQTLLYVQAFLYGNIEWSYFPFLPWAVYPLIGFIYSTIHVKFKLKDAFKDLLAITSIVFSFVTITYGVNNASDLKIYYHHDWLYTIWIFQFLILMVYVFDKLDAICGKYPLLIYIKWIGKNVTAVYVIQWLLIGNIATWIFRTQSEVALVIWFVSILMLTSIAVYFYEQKFRKRKSTLLVK